MKYGSLFSGAGLGDFGFEMAGFDVRWQVELNDYARKVLDLRWPDVKKYKDIKQIDPKELEAVDLITGGFPCQPFSVAGKRDGADDDRNLWPEMLRIIKALKPRWVVAENVPGIIDLYLDAVLADLEDQGYTCWPVVFSSHSLGAWHKRERLWIIANAGLLGPQKHEESAAGIKQLGEALADTGLEYGARNAKGMETSKAERSASNLFAEPSSSGLFARYWTVEPPLGRLAHGVARRVDRLKCLGNGQTPCSTYAIANWIRAVEQTSHNNM